MLNPFEPLKQVETQPNRRFEDIEQALLAIDHALQTYTDLYDLREVIEFQLENNIRLESCVKRANMKLVDVKSTNVKII